MYMLPPKDTHRCLALATWAHVDEQISAQNSNSVEWPHKLYVTMVLFKCVCYVFP